MGYDREISREEVNKHNRITATWEIRKSIENCPIGTLTIEELPLLTRLFKYRGIETPTREELEKLLLIQTKLLKLSD